MRYQVPQFTEVESKIFGQLTFKQFIYLFGGGGVLFVLFTTLPLFLFFIFGIPFAIFSAALAFHKVNNQPFIKVVENAVKFLLSPKLFLWKKTPPKKIVRENKESPRETTPIYIPRFTKSKLKDLAWSLDIKEKIK